MMSLQEHNDILTKIFLRCHWVTDFPRRSFIAIYSRWEGVLLLKRKQSGKFLVVLY